MKKLVFTLAFGLFFVAFTNAQSVQTEKSVEADQIVKVETQSTDKAEAKPACNTTKEATDCKPKAAKTAKTRPSCADKKTSCGSKKTSCGSKKS